MKLLSALAVVSVLLCTGVSCSPAVGLYRSDSKVWIISAGLDYDNSTVPSLNGTVEDALEVAQCLSQIYRARGYESVVLPMISQGSGTGKEDCFYPCSENIMNVLDSVNPSADDVVVFYWSGHGHVDEHGMFLVTAPVDNNNYTALYIDFLTEVLQSYPCPCILIVDACYSGAGVEGKTGVEYVSPSDAAADNVQILAACRAEETAKTNYVFTEEGLPEAHSVFTSFILDELGWVHSVSQKNILYGYEVYGSLPELPQKTGCQEFFRRIENAMSSETQEPVMNRTSVSVLMIP